MRRFPHPSAVLVALVLLVAVVATACGAVTPYAARIDGGEISRRDFQNELDAILSNQQYVENLELGGGPVRGQGQGTLQSSFVADVLSVRIILELIRQEVERREVGITSAVRDLARESVVNQVGGAEVLAGFGDDYRRRLLRRTEEVFALQLDLAGASLAEEDLRGRYREEGDAFEETCVSHILVAATDEQGVPDAAAIEAQAAELRARAEELRAAILGGAEFAAVAEAESVDTQSAAQGGELGCAPPGRYVPEFEDAVSELEVDQLSEPVRTQFGFHLILVTDRRPAPFDEVADQLRQRVLQESQEQLQRYIQERLAGADVEVNPRYGRFESEGSRVVPPDAPEGGGQREPRGQQTPPGVAPLP